MALPTTLLLVPLVAKAPLRAPQAPRSPCDDAEEVYEDQLGDIDARPVFLRICTTSQGDDTQRALVMINWQAPEGQQDVWQTLLDGAATAPAGIWSPSLQDGTLTLRYPSGRRGDPTDQYTIETWRWQSGSRRFDDHQTVTTSPWSEGKARLDAALSKGDLAAARAEVATLGTTPNGGVTWLDQEIYLDFLKVAEAQAQRRHRLWDEEGAAQIAWDILADPPLSSHLDAPTGGGLVICKGLVASCTGKGNFNELPRAAEVANHLAALAFYLAQGGRPEAALAVLDPLLAAFPLSGDLERTRGDAFWALDRKDEARASWRRAVELGASLPKKTVKRLGG